MLSGRGADSPGNDYVSQPTHQRRIVSSEGDDGQQQRQTLEHDGGGDKEAIPGENPGPRPEIENRCREICRCQILRKNFTNSHG